VPGNIADQGDRIISSRSAPSGHVKMPEQSGRCDAEPVYFLLHIPKTAGQTIQQHFARHCAPGVFWQSSRKLRRGRRERPDALPDRNRARIIAGHHINCSLEDLFKGREIRRILLLRDPLQLQISLYNWMMMNNIAKGFGTYSFDLHLHALRRNFMADFLLSRWLGITRRSLLVMADEEKYRRLNRMLAGFWFVGAHTDCDRLIAEIAPGLGVPATAPRRNTAVELLAQTGWRLLTSDSLPLSVHCAIRTRNRLDQALWEHWSTAGFNPASIRPPALTGGERGRIVDEIVRPRLILRQFAARRKGSWLSATAAGEVKLTAADRARDAGQWELAARRYGEALRRLPKGPAIWVQYGHALKAIGKVAEAEGAYREALRLNPTSADTHLQLGHVLKLQGRLGKAEQAYQRSVLLDPTGCHARDELIALGWTKERLELTIAATRREPSDIHRQSSC
jgi:hypothetical protein